MNTSNSDKFAVSYPGGDTCSGISGLSKRSTLINLYCSDDVVPVTSVLSEASCSVSLQSSLISD